MCKSAAYFWVLGLTDADLKFNLNFNTCSTVVSHPCFLSLMCTCPCPWEGYSLKIDCFSDSDWWWGEIIGKTPIIFYLTHTKGDFFKVQIPWFFLKGTKIAGIYNCMHDQVTGNRLKKNMAVRIVVILQLCHFYRIMYESLCTCKSFIPLRAGDDGRAKSSQIIYQWP